ncbi:MAG: circadian clock protein KaiC [Gemmatimonadota bacterium]|nr:circadian clock protein KaiC [Gemmatimonadota bacterium]
MPASETQSIEKTPTGIKGFDEITGGGLPRNRTTLVMGTPGAGKTIFALEALVNGARISGDSGIFIAFEENARHIIENAATFGWDLPALERDKLFFLDAKLPPTIVSSGDFDLTGILAAISAKAGEMSCKRIVFDGLDVLLTMLNDPVAERREVYRLHEWLLSSGVTGIITAKSEDGGVGMLPERYAFMQFMVDCVVSLHHRLVDRVSLRGLRVLKYRGSAFSENEFPLVISPTGIEVATSGTSEMSHEVSTERVSTGVERLDTMLGGGYYRVSSVLVTGAPGTSKTTLAGSFAAAACRRGEAALYVSFDEAADQIVRNLASVGIGLQEHRDAGLLHMYSIRTEVMSAEAHFIELKKLICDLKPRCMVLDPISALAKTGGQVAAVHASLRLLDYAKAQGITVFCTSLVSNTDALTESTITQISTIADTWIHLSYVVLAGERNRSITIVKSRGTKHSNQVRELLLSNEGITLSDVYSAGGEVLMGTARWEKEAEVREQEAQRRVRSERARRELELAEAEVAARIAALQRELEARRAELALVDAEDASREHGVGAAHDTILRLRGGVGDSQAVNAAAAGKRASASRPA